MSEKVRVQRTVFDLDSFAEVTLAKEFEFTAPATIEEALSRLGNDSAKLLEVVAEGLKAEERRKIAAIPTDWHSLTDENEVNGAFTGTIADPKAVGGLVLTLAKTVFGYTKDSGADQKKQAKINAMAMIQNTPAIREGLKKSAALQPEE